MRVSIVNVCLVVCAAILCISGSAMAVGVVSDVEAGVWADIHWDSLTVTCENGVTLVGFDDGTGLGYYSLSEAMVGDYWGGFSGETYEVYSWESTYAYANNSNLESGSWTDSDCITSTSLSYGYNEGNEDAGMAEGLSVRYGAFEVSGAGQITITVDYNLEVGLYSYDYDSDARGFAEAWLYLSNDTSFESDSAEEYIEEFAFGGDYYIYDAGQLEVTLYFEDGDVLYFDTGVSTESEFYIVPEPATLAMLALGGLVLRRKN